MSQREEPRSFGASYGLRFAASNVYVSLLCAGALLWPVMPSYAQVSTDAQRDAEEQRRIQERETQLRTQQERTKDMPGTAAPTVNAVRLPAQESPCFPIRQVELHAELQGDVAQRFAWVLDSLSGPLADDAPLGQCIGAIGIGILQQRAQDALIAKGYSTTRILVSQQNLRTGKLILHLMPGRISAVRTTPDMAQRTLRSALPMREGDILNLRDIEQALDNFQRTPTRKVDIQIGKANAPDQSELIIRSENNFPLRLSLSLDDSGSKYTGRYQASATLSWDNPLGLNDLFYIVQGNDAQGGMPGPRGTQNNTLHYSLPWGYWSYGLTLSDSSYYQSIAATTSDYVYRGNSSSTELKASRLFYRDAKSKSTLYLKALQRNARNYVNDQELSYQRRASTLWELGVEHKTFIGHGRLELSWAHKRGTRDFDAIDAAEEAIGQGTARPSFWGADLTWETPWSAWKLPLTYQAHLRMQATDLALAAPDRFALGGRYTVRGFDGENTITGDAGWLLRQELGYQLGQQGGQIYVALDMGEVDGPNTRGLSDRFLAGTALGWRIQYKKLHFDCFVGRPLHTPPSLRTSETAAGFYLNYTL